MNQMFYMGCMYTANAPARRSESAPLVDVAAAVSAAAAAVVAAAVASVAAAQR